MIRSLQSTVDYLRRALGFAGDEVAVLKGGIIRNSGAALLRRKRAKVAGFAILFGIVSAVIELPLPAEDFYRAMRAEVRSKPAPQDVVMIAIDDKTLNAFARSLPSRVDDSRLIDTLIASGVGKVVFDRAHADPENPQADTLFAQTLARHKGKVWLGFAPGHELGFQTVEEIVPRPAFREEAQLAAMNGMGNPFGLSVIFPTSVNLNGSRHPSLSAALANYTGPDRFYRPDYAFNLDSIPTFSYIDVLRSEVSAKDLAGKNVVVGERFYESADYFRLPLRDGKVAGAYFHIMGAHTLKRGVPVDLMWVPALLVAGLAIMAQVLAN
ncbi:MAG: CHASE2 domain-containing protein, partial [Paracoccaceae bacterium]|nr:CHASE2 domain-containing protein [Paracoccaceae bacterium]